MNKQHLFNESVRHQGDAGFKQRPLAMGVRLALASGIMVGCMGLHAAEGLPVPKVGSEWTGSKATLQVLNGRTMNIMQKDRKATFNWKSFDINAGKVVNFKQPDVSAIALNNIDARGKPSQIFGTLNANGQIYLVNPDGVVFGKGSRVDVGSLVASSLKIDQSILDKGLTKSGNVTSVNDTYAALEGKGDIFLVDPATGNFVVDDQGQKMKIKAVVDAKAIIKTSPGGRVIIAAPEVLNKGRIETPKGQTILVGATDKVYLQEDSGIRGLLVEVKTGGSVENLGTILAKQGNATLLGFAVNQRGRISASTSVRNNGSVRLLARENGSFQSQPDSVDLIPGTTKREAKGEDGLGSEAKVSLGSTSVTEVLPDFDDKTTASIKEIQQKSKVEISGKHVHIKSGAQVIARSGEIVVNATENPETPENLSSRQDDTRVLVENGAVLDASGLKNVKKSVADNILEQEVRRNELRDSPLQRGGVLYAKTVRFDRRKLPKIVDVSGALDRYQEGIAERSTEGGSITLRSSGDVVLEKKSVLNVSGGAVAYKGAIVQTTSLIDEGGRTVSIDKANPQGRYRALIGDVSKDGAKPASSVPGSYYERGYIEGKSAGTVGLVAGKVVADGKLVAGTQVGIHQRDAATQPSGGKLSIDMSSLTSEPWDVVIDRSKQLVSDSLDIDVPLPEATTSLTLTAEQLKQSAFQHVLLKTFGQVLLKQNASVVLPTRGSLHLEGGELAIDGSVDIASGKFEASTNLGLGGIRVGASANIDVSGQWVNDFKGPLAARPIGLNGGEVSMASIGDIEFAQGSRVAANGGAWRNTSGKLTEGHGGAISFRTSQVDGSNLTLKGNLTAYALHQGGTLNLETNQIIIGNNEPGGDPLDRLKPLLLKPEFFRQGGFQNFNLLSNLREAVVQGNARIELKAQNWQLDAKKLTRPSERFLDGLVSLTSLPDAERQPVNFSLSLHHFPSTFSAEHSLVVEKGAVFLADPGASVAFSADTRVLFDGQVSAPGGHVKMETVSPNSVDFPGFLPDLGVFLGTQAKIDARGATEVIATRSNLRRLDLFDGGSVTLRAEQGFVVAASGAKIDVSGALDRFDRALQNGQVRSEAIATAGGSISVTAQEGIALDAELSAAGGNGSRPGGALLLNLDGTLRQDRRSEAEIRRDGQQVFPVASGVVRVMGFDGGVIPSGWIPGQELPLAVFREARISSRRVQNGGFSDVALKVLTPDQLSGVAQAQDEIRFEGNVNLAPSARLALAAPVISWVPESENSSGRVDLSAAYVSLGSDFSRQAPQVPVLGLGALKVKADLIDLIGGTALTGFEQVELTSSGDIRGVGRRVFADQRDLVGELRSAANLTLMAQQVYPTTLSQFAIAVTSEDGRIDIRSHDRTPPVAPLSAAGRLTIEASKINQAGVLRAPFGTIELHKGRDADGNVIEADQIQIAQDSLTSVSGKGLQVPFGRTEEGGSKWFYPFFGSFQNLSILGSPDKRVSLSARDMTVENGAVVDFSGGGELSAYEFVGKGPGGSYNAVSPDSPTIPLDQRAPFETKYAILPSLGSQFAPYDALEFASYESLGLTVGKTIHLSGVSGLPTGDYALLPARYALLPGAFLVTPQAGLDDMRAGEVRESLSGAKISAGYFGFAGQNTQVPSGYWQGFTVQDGGFLRQQSELIETRASSFFGVNGPGKTVNAIAPRDAGQFVLKPSVKLILEGSLLSKAASAGGRPGLVDISAENLKIVNQLSANPVANTVELSAGGLAQLRSGSLLLGGTRTITGQGTRIDAFAQSVTLDKNVSLTGPEVLMVARDRVNLDEGSFLQAAGNVSGAPDSLLLAGGDALLRVSTADVASIGRTQSISNGGTLTVAASARIQSPGSVNVDTTGDTQLLGAIDMQGGSLGLGANQLNVGEVPANAPGLNLTADFLGRFKASKFFLRSTNDVHLYGQASLQAGELTINAPGISGFGASGNTASLSADRIELMNLDGPGNQAPASGTGSLTLTTKDLVLGTGEFRVQGFQRHSLLASHLVQGDGDGQFAFQGDLSLQSPLLTASNGATTKLDVSGDLLIGTAGQAADASIIPGWGGSWQFTGDSIVHGGRIRLPSGLVKLQSKGAVTLAKDSVIDVSAVAKEYASGRYIPVGGGSVEVTSEQGQILLADGGTISLKGLAGSTSAGTFRAQAPQGALIWNGTIEAGAGGSFHLDANSLGNGGFNSLYGRVRQAGFDNLLSFRQRQGDVEVEGGSAANPVRADLLKVVADNGDLTLGGHFNLSGTDGGEGQFWAGDSVVLKASTVMQARATDRDGKGGRLVFGGGRAGQLEVQSGAELDVSGGAEGTGGEVLFRVYRNAQDEAQVGNIAAKISGADSVNLEAVRSIEASVADLAGWKKLTADFMDTTGAVLQNRFANGISVIPGLEIVSNGDFTLDESWNLADWRYAGKAGALTLRVQGNLNFNAPLSDAFALGYVPGVARVANNRINNYLQEGSSWSYRLASGADLGSSNMLAVNAGHGDLTLSKGAVIRTGTGNIDVAAGRDIRLTDFNSSIYTAGRPGADRYGKQNTLDRIWYAEFPVDGGDITLDAGGDIIGAATPQLTTNWLARIGNFGTVPEIHPPLQRRFATAWGILFDASVNQLGASGMNAGPATNIGFKENVGALGGGNVRVTSGGVVKDLSVMLPTTGKPVGKFNSAKNEFETNEPLIQGGGNLYVSAGSDILGGVYFVDKGKAVLEAGGSVKGGTQYDQGPLVALGDSQFELRARRDLQIGAVFNASWVPSVASANPSYFSRYTDQSSVQFVAAGGDLVLNNDADKIKSEYMRLDAQGRKTVRVIGAIDTDFTLSTYPGSVLGFAAAGDLHIERSFTLFPVPQGNLELVAGGNILSGTGQLRTFVTMSDAERSILPDAFHPIATGVAAVNLLLSPNPGVQQNAHALVPVHLNDSQPAIITTLGGSLLGSFQSADALQFNIPKPVLANVHGDIVGVSFKLQHNRENQVSRIKAGGGIRFETIRDPFTGALQESDQRIEVAGPGSLQVIAGGDVDLGSTNGILSIGNAENSALAENGASLHVLAALPKGFVDDAFVDKYLVKGDFYRLDLALYMERRFGEQVEQQFPNFASRLHDANTNIRRVAIEDAVKAFTALPAEQRVDFSLRVLFSEIRLSSAAAAVRAGRLEFASALEQLRVADWKQDLDGSASSSALSVAGLTLENRLSQIVNNPNRAASGYEDAETAIATLFPADAIGKGDISMFYSTIQSKAGGDDNESPIADSRSSLADRTANALAKDYSGNDSDITLVTLGGLANLGLASANGVSRPADQLGVIVRRDGAANALIDGDFQVNRARFIANGGGDASVYSRNANIDAGLGSNSAFAVQQELRSFDVLGRFIQDFVPSVAGSGIQANARPTERRGNVFLGVPKGQVFISEAGITGDSVVAPSLVGNQAFVNTTSSTGGSTTVAAVPTDIGSVASNAARAATDAASGDASKDGSRGGDKDAAAKSVASILSADVIGYGSCSAAEAREGKKDCRS